MPQPPSQLDPRRHHPLLRVFRVLRVLRCSRLRLRRRHAVKFVLLRKEEMGNDIPSNIVWLSAVGALAVPNADAMLCSICLLVSEERTLGPNWRLERSSY